MCENGVFLRKIVVSGKGVPAQNNVPQLLAELGLFLSVDLRLSLLV